MKDKNKNYSLPSTHYLSSKGFTLIELIISLAMVAIITGAVLQVARFSDTHKSMTLATDQFRAVLRTAQSSALSVPIHEISDPDKQHICGYGVYIKDSSEYLLFYTTVKKNDFKTNPFSCRDDEEYRYYDGRPQDTNDIQSFKLEDGLKFTATDRSIFFIAPYGEVCDDTGAMMDEVSPDFDFKIEMNAGGASRDISVNSFGKIN